MCGGATKLSWRFSSELAEFWRKHSISTRFDQFQLNEFCSFFNYPFFKFIWNLLSVLKFFLKFSILKMSSNLSENFPESIHIQYCSFNKSFSLLHLKHPKINLKMRVSANHQFLNSQLLNHFFNHCILIEDCFTIPQTNYCRI